MANEVTITLPGVTTQVVTQPSTYNEAAQAMSLAGVPSFTISGDTNFLYRPGKTIPTVTDLTLTATPADSTFEITSYAWFYTNSDGDLIAIAGATSQSITIAYNAAYLWDSSVVLWVKINDVYLYSATITKTVEADVWSLTIAGTASISYDSTKANPKPSEDQTYIATLLINNATPAEGTTVTYAWVAHGNISIKSGANTASCIVRVASSKSNDDTYIQCTAYNTEYKAIAVYNIAISYYVGASNYCGALTTAPTEGIYDNCYYFDNNTPEDGGGVIRYYNGSTWVQATSEWAQWATAWKVAIADATAWATANNATLADVSAFMNAIINNLVVKNGIIDYLATSTQVSTALCSDGVTRRMEIDWDNAVEHLRSYTQDNLLEIRDGVINAFSGFLKKRLGLSLTNSSVSFKNAPVGGIEETIAALSRITSTAKYVLASGNWKTPINTGASLVTANTTLSSRVWSAQAWSPSLGIFCIISSTTETDTKVATSSDGIIWTERMASATSGRGYFNLAWSEELGLFCSLSYYGNYVLLSSDGVTWTEYATGLSPYSHINYFIKWSKKYSFFIASGDNGIYISNNGISWRQAFSLQGGYFGAIILADSISTILVQTYNNGLGRIAKSTDGGVTWTVSVISADRRFLPGCWSPTLSMFLIGSVGNSDNNYYIYKSNDGITWELCKQFGWDIRGPWYPQASYILWSEEMGLFIGIGSSTNTNIYTSKNGITWETKLHVGISMQTAYGPPAWSEDLSKFVTTTTSTYTPVVFSLNSYAKLGAGIIASGYVAGSGYYVVWSSGLALCVFSGMDSLSLSNAWGSLYVSTVKTWTFPIAFSTLLYCGGTPIIGPDIYSCFLIPGGVTTNTQHKYQYAGATIQGTTFSIYPGLLAIGFVDPSLWGG